LVARVECDDEWDWTYYNVNMYVYPLISSIVTRIRLSSFVDRDMLMRYIGGGVGHDADGGREPAPELSTGDRINSGEEDEVEGGAANDAHTSGSPVDEDMEEDEEEEEEEDEEEVEEEEEVEDDEDDASSDDELDPEMDDIPHDSDEDDDPELGDDFYTAVPF
jgi:hypothetical protein